MDKAKAAISDFMGKAGHHDTSVHETVAPAVTHETVKSHNHEQVSTAVDKEVHQDHYHRTVQPVHDREVLPETHETKLGSVQHREFDHRDHDTTKRTLLQDQEQFRDERTVAGTTSSRSVAPTVGGEHVHHHIHETIQPVIHKETIQPNVVHTTVPIHEVHHNKATHHDTTSLPAMNIDQFKAQGGSLTGREERYDEFKGVPKNIGGGAAGGLGAVRGLEHKHGEHSKENARHGDFHDTAYHESGADIRQGGLTHNTTTTGHQQGITGSSTAGGLTGHHDHQHQHHDHHHTDRGLTGTSGGVTGSSATGGLTGHRDNTQHTDRGLTGSSTTGGMTGSSATGGLTGHDQHQHADRGMGGQGNLTGSSTQGGVVSSGQRDDTVTKGDRNAGTGRSADGVVEGIAGHGKDELRHRENEDGALPKALTEERSKAVPHSKLQDDQHTTGHNTHGNTTGETTSGTQKKAGLMDRLNPMTDSNGDGQKGFMK